MSFLEKFEGEDALEVIKDLNYRGPSTIDAIEGTILSLSDLGSPSASGWLPADGSLVSKTMYPALYASIGDTYALEDDDLSTDDFRLPSIPFHFIKWSPMINPFILENINALKNTIKLLLFSEPTDYNRDIGTGGLVYSFIKKPMNAVTEGEIINKVKKALESFNTLITHDVKVVRDVESKTWLISISYSDLLNKYTANTQLALG